MVFVQIKQARYALPISASQVIYLLLDRAWIADTLPLDFMLS